MRVPVVQMLIFVLIYQSSELSEKYVRMQTLFRLVEIAMTVIGIGLVAVTRWPVYQ